MNPAILQQLAAERVNHMITKADERHQVRQARLARRSQSSREETRPSLPRRQAETEPRSANTAARAVLAIGMPRPSADDGQDCELIGTERGIRGPDETA